MRDSVTLVCLLIFATDVFGLIAKASAEDGCYWTGKGPSCEDSSCQSDEFVFAESRTGPDGIQCVTGLKKYCCKLAMESQWIGKDDPNILVTPSSQSVSDCYWTGSPPDCQGFCQEGEYVAATSRKGLGQDCITESKKLCCKTPAILPSPGFAVQMESISTTTASSPTGQSSSLEERGKNCYWSGAAPICDGWCQAGEYVAAQSRKGNDGNVCASGYKKYCCKMWHHRVYPPTIQIFVVNSTVRRYVPTENNQSNEYNQTISLPKLTFPSWTRITLSPQHNILTSPSSLMGNKNTISLAPLKQTQVNNATPEEKSSVIDNNSELKYQTPFSVLMNTLRTSSTVSSTKEMNTSSVNGDVPSRISNTTNLIESKSNASNVSNTVENHPSEILSTTVTSTSFEKLTKEAPETDTISINPIELHKQEAKVGTSSISTTMKPATTYLSTTTATSLSSSSTPAKLSITSEMPNLLPVHLSEPEDPSTRFTSSSVAMNATEQQTMSESPIDEGNRTSLLIPLLEENKSDNVSTIAETTTSPSVRTNSLQKLFYSSLSLTTQSLSLSSQLDRNSSTSKIPYYFHNSNASELTNSSVFGYPKDFLPNDSISEGNKTRIHPQLTTLISPSSTLAPPPKSVSAPLLNFSASEIDSSVTENSSIFLSRDMVVKTTLISQQNKESKLTTHIITAVLDSPLFSDNTNSTTQPIDETTAAFPISTTSAPLSQVTNATIPINEPLHLARITTVASTIKNINMTVSLTSSSTIMPPLLRTHQSSSATLVGVQATAQEDTISTSSPQSEFRNVNADISVVRQNASQTPTSTINMQTTTTEESASEDPSLDSHSIEKETSSVPSSSSVLLNSTMLIPLIVQNTTRSSSSLPPEKQTMNVSASAKNATSISPMEPSSPSSIITSTTSTSLNPEPVFDSLDSKLNQTGSRPTLIEDASLFIESKENISAAPTTSKSVISTLPRKNGSQLSKSQQKTFQPFIITPVPEMEAITTYFESSTINDHTSNESSTSATKQETTLSTASISSFPTLATLHTSITDVLNITIPDMISMASPPIADDGTNTTFTSTVDSEKATTLSQSTNFKTSRFSTTESTPLNPKETTTVATTFGTTAPLITSNEGTDLSELFNPDQQDRMDVERNETALKTSPSLMLTTPVLFPIDQPLSMSLNQKWVPMVAEKSLSHFDDTIARIPISADMVAIPSLNHVQLFQPKADILASKEPTKTNLKSTKLTAGKEFGNIDSSGFIPIIPPIPQN